MLSKHSWFSFLLKVRRKKIVFLFVSCFTLNKFYVIKSYLQLCSYFCLENKMLDLLPILVILFCFVSCIRNLVRKGRFGRFHILEIGILFLFFSKEIIIFHSHPWDIILIVNVFHFLSLFFCIFFRWHSLWPMSCTKFIINLN